MIKDSEHEKKFYEDKKKESNDNSLSNDYDLKKFTKKFVDKLCKENGYYDIEPISKEEKIKVNNF